MNESEIKQCRVLTMVPKNADVSNFKERALRVLDENPDNPLALMVYNAEFRGFLDHGPLVSLTFNENVVERFLFAHGDTLDFDTFLAITRLVLMKETNSETDDTQLMGTVLNHADVACKDADALAAFYDFTVKTLCNQDRLNYFTNTLFFSDCADNIADAFKAQKIMAKVILKRLQNLTAIAADKKAALIKIITDSPLYEKPPAAPQATTTQQQPPAKKSRHIGLFVLLGIAIVILYLFITNL